MKSGFVIVLLAIGTLICATYAAPASSEIEEKNDQEKVKELLDLINQAVKSQQGDEDEDEESAEARFFKRILKASELLKDIAKLQQNDDDDDNENALVDNMGEMAKEEDGLSEEAQAQFWSALIPLGASLFGSLFNRRG